MKCSKIYNVENIPISNCSDLTKKYQIKEQLIGGIESLVYKVTNFDSTYILKIVPAHNPALIEIMIGCQLGVLVVNNISKSYLVPIEWNKCNTFPSGSQTKIFDILSKGISYYIIIPWANYTLVTIGGQIMSDYDLICMVFELLYALVSARYYFEGFAHNDLKAANIFIFKTNKHRTYQLLNDTNFYMKSNLLGTMGDFGQAYAKIINDDLYDYPPKNKGKADIAKLIGSFVKSFPQSSLINQLNNLTNILIAKDQGYQDYDTIIKILSVHPLFDDLKTKQLVENTNTINMISWEDATKE